MEQNKNVLTVSKYGVSLPLSADGMQHEAATHVFLHLLCGLVVVIIIPFFHFPCNTISKSCDRGSMAFFTSSKVFVWAPASIRTDLGRRWRL